MDDALKKVEAAGHAIRTVLVFDHTLAAKRADVAWVAGRDVWWQDAVAQHPTTCEIEWMGAEDPLFKVRLWGLSPHGTLGLCITSMLRHAGHPSYQLAARQADSLSRQRGPRGKP